MAWTPENQVIDATLFVDNLLQFIKDNDEDALRWANDNERLDGFASLYPNAPGRLITKFPSLVVLSQEMGTDLKGDNLQGALQLTMEGCVKGPNLDDLVLKTKKYAMAVESMLGNAPAAELMNNAKTAGHSTLLEIGTAFDLSGQLKTANSFLAIFRTEALYRITASAY